MDESTANKIVEAHRNLCQFLNHRSYTCNDDIGRSQCSDDCEYMKRFKSDLKQITDEQDNR